MSRAHLHIAIIIIGLGVVLSGAARADSFYVIDGDTFSLNGETYRLWGIDAPERRQFCSIERKSYPCGTKSRQYLRDLIKDPDALQCASKPRGRHETRQVVQCKINGKDVGGAMVAAGWATDYHYFSKGHYAREQASAKKARRGIWAGNFKNPRDWRRDNPR